MKAKPIPAHHPLSCSYEDMRRDMAGRKPRTAEQQRMEIDQLLNTLTEANAFWTLEVIRRTLDKLTEFDDRSISHMLLLQDANIANDGQLRQIAMVTRYAIKIKRRGKRKPTPKTTTTEEHKEEAQHVDP